MARRAMLWTVCSALIALAQGGCSSAGGPSATTGPPAQDVALDVTVGDNDAPPPTTPTTPTTSTTPTTPTTPIAPIAPPTTTTMFTTTTAATAPIPEASLTTMPQNAAGETLTNFADAVRRFHQGVQPLLAEAALVPAGGPVPPAVAQHASGAVDQFFGLPATISDGLHPAVRSAAVDVLFALGREIAPFLFAPGWEFDGWAVWAGGVQAAQLDVPAVVARLADQAVLHPDTAVEDLSGAHGAAFHGGLHVLLVRAFGHANFNTQPPWSVRWIGGLPPGSKGQPCFIDGRPLSAGTFIDGEGGCAVLYYDSADPAIHDAELAAWLEDPATPPEFMGEVIGIRWMDGRWVGIGSAE